MTTVRVLVADDDELIREVLLELLGTDPRFDVVGVVADAAAAIEMAERERPAVALVDVKMPEGGGQRVATELRTRSPATRVVALSSYEDRTAIVDMFRAGAVSYLVKGAGNNADIATTLVRVAAGEVVLPPTVGTHLLDELSSYLERTHTAERRHQATEGRIRRTLAGHRIPIAYQPIVDLSSAEPCGYEALARFPDEPRQGPDRWFADAAAVGLQVELELLAVRSAIDAIERIPSGTYLALNVSPITACDPALQALVLDRVPGATVIEVTEHAVIDDYDQFARAIEPLRAAGVRLAVDDAGAGFASLHHILALAPDLIKLDRSLTIRIDIDRSRRALARALISFGSEVEATIVAEGIETRAELDALRRLGVTTGQGYLLCRPGPLDGILDDASLTLGR
jgi:EAL domain-containing protein (putative c-di-GMP-specific phosphodiesterase class I)/DNA-binding NarL/FixJ family response regulator